MGKMSRKNLHELFIFFNQLVNVLDAIRDIMCQVLTSSFRLLNNLGFCFPSSEHTTPILRVYNRGSQIPLSRLFSSESRHPTLFYA